MSATRGEATLSSLGVSADVLDRQRIDDRAAPSLLPLLQEVPGVATARAGQTGLQGSVFIRGGESRYACVLVDGVAVNQPGGSFDFGTVLPFELERVEVVRGAASSLYGNDALAGVVSLQTRRARPGESPSLRAEGEGGSFDWQRGLLATSGARGRFDWSAGVQRLTTDNEEPNSRFEQTAAALSAGARIDSRTDARAVVRFDDSTTGTPGPTAFGRPDQDASFEREDLVVSALGAPRPSPPLAAAERRLRAHGPAVPEPGRLRPVGPGVGRRLRVLPALRLPERGRVPEPDGAPRRRVPGRSLRRDTAPPDRRRRGRARDGRARQPRRGAADAGAHELRGLRAGPPAAGLARVPDGGRARREKRQLRDARRAARRSRRAPPRRRGRDDPPGERRHGDQGAELPRVVRRVLLREGQPRPRPRAQHDLRPRASSSVSSGAGCARRSRPSTTSTATRSRTRSWTSTPSRART